MSCDVGHRSGLDPYTVTVVQGSSCSSNLTPTWEPLYAMGMALKNKKKKKKERKRNRSHRGRQRAHGRGKGTNGKWLIKCCSQTFCLERARIVSFHTQLARESHRIWTYYVNGVEMYNPPIGKDCQLLNHCALYILNNYALYNLHVSKFSGFSN